MTPLALTFATPLGLLGLLVIPVVLLAWWGSRARARKTAIRYPAASTLALAGGGGDVGRYLAGALAILAAAALSLALAKPTKAVRVPIEQASLVLVTDHSGSMAATDVNPTRLDAAKSAAQTFIGELPKPVKVGAVAFSAVPDAVQAPSTDHDAARRVIANQTADGATATGDALQAALNVLLAPNAANPAKHPPAAIVLLSDGATTPGTSDPMIAAQRAKQSKVPIYTVALGSDGATVPNPDPFGQPLSAAPDSEALQQIAKTTGGKSFQVDDAGKLKQIYKDLGSKLGTHAESKQVTSSFAIGGLVLLIGALIASVLTIGRLP